MQAMDRSSSPVDDAAGVRGLTASPAAALSFTTALRTRAFHLHRPGGDLLVYAAGGWSGETAVRDQYLGHWHEAAEGGDVAGRRVHVHVADADEANDRLPVPAASFETPFALDEDFRAIPMPGHTPGSTAYLWRAGDDAVLFCADTVYPRDDGVWRAAVLESSDRGAMADSLERLASLAFNVVAPWVSPIDAPAAVRVQPAAGRRQLLDAAERVRGGGS
jgi:glyoxylase-like metal-dependent hydrolase (beta-lactamase superfamily II)